MNVWFAGLVYQAALRCDAFLCSMTRAIASSQSSGRAKKSLRLVAAQLEQSFCLLRYLNSLGGDSHVEPVPHVDNRFNNPCAGVFARIVMHAGRDPVSRVIGGTAAAS